MRVLVIDAYDEADPDSHVVRAAIDSLQRRGHDVEHLSLATDELAGFMTPAEHRAYESETPLIAAETKASAFSVQAADALLFCYPTTLFGVPPRLKSWLERVMVMGVAFVFDDKKRVRPGLKNVRHLGVITTSPHSVRATMRARDLGRRTLMRTLRLNCHPLCMRTFVRLRAGGAHHAAIDRRLVRWR